jgi:hypothetical protein
MQDNHLTEKSLGEILNIIFPTKTFIHNKYFTFDDDFKCRPDYRCNELNLVIEFNGYMHYNNAITQNRDKKKLHHLTSIGFKLIEIPYFVQLTKQMIDHYFCSYNGFEHHHSINSSYPHGFISNKALLPVDFNTFGHEKYLLELECLPNNVHDEILESIRTKSEKLGFYCG